MNPPFQVVPPTPPSVKTGSRQLKATELIGRSGLGGDDASVGDGEGEAGAAEGSEMAPAVDEGLALGET